MAARSLRRTSCSISAPRLSAIDDAGENVGSSSPRDPTSRRSVGSRKRSTRPTRLHPFLHHMQELGRRFPRKTQPIEAEPVTHIVDACGKARKLHHGGGGWGG